MRIALSGEPFDSLRIIATFAKRENWTQVYQDQRCWWSWVGPVVPPYELAENLFRKPLMDPYERAVRLAEEWQKTDETRKLLQDVIKLAEEIGGFDHETKWRPRCG
jgi:aspartate-semialdehyde dehydrogenase